VIGQLDLARFDAACDPEFLRHGLELGLVHVRDGPVQLKDLQVSRIFPRQQGGLTLEVSAQVHREGSRVPEWVVLGGHLLGASEVWPGYVATHAAKVVCFEDLRLVVPIFPFDPELPLLPKLVRAEHALVLLRGAGVPGLEDAWALVPQLLGYRLERRCVLRHHPRAGSLCPTAPRLVTKSFRPGHMKGIQRAIRALTMGGATDLAPKPLLLDAGRGLYVSEEVSGRSLLDLIATREFAAGCEGAGLALARLHALPREALPPQYVEHSLRPLESLVDLACELLPEWAQDFRSIRHAVRAERPVDLEAVSEAAVHGDFYDKQVLCAAERVTVLDWDGLARGDPARDHGNFTAHVALRATQMPAFAAQVEPGAAAFERGYGACDHAFSARASWWEAATLVRLAVLYGLRPRWRHLVPALLQRAARSLQSPARVAMLAMFLSSMASDARDSHAQAPEYVKIKPHAGQSLEISGVMGDDGIFVASDIEDLGQPRRLQLRGVLESVDVEMRSLVVHGVPMHLTKDSKFDDADSTRTDLAGMRPGQRIEVSCDVDEQGAWTIHQLRTHAIKASDKIKGTITRAAVDGAPPDTIEVSGLRILLVAATDVNVPKLRESPLERALFPDLARRDRNDPTVTLAGDKLELIGDYRGHVRSRSDFDLSPRFDSDTSEALSELRLGLASYWSDPIWSFAQVRLRGYATADRRLPYDRIEAHVSQLYVLFRTRGTFRAALQLGRQDFEDPREWIFDEYLDAARIVLYAPGSFVFEGAFIRPFLPINPAFETWTDGFAMARWYFDSRSHVAAWALARSDRDPVRNREPVWIGGRYWGIVRGGLRPWLDAAVMRGEDKHRKLRAWGLDAGATWHVSMPGKPVVTAGYAVGSGDASTSDGVDGNFRQTGYEDNWARFGGVVAQKIYGSLLDPELSNIEVTTLGAGMQPWADASVEVVWHGYRQQAATDKLQGSNLIDPPARPNGESRDLGWTVEVTTAAPTLWGKLRAGWTFAFFRPGAAFNPRREDAIWNRLELTARF